MGRSSPSSNTVTCTRSACSRTCHASTSSKVEAVCGVPAQVPGDGAGGGGLATADPSGCPRSTARKRSATVSAAPSASSCKATPKARSTRSSSSMRARLSSPRSWSSRLASVTGGSSAAPGRSSRSVASTSDSSPAASAPGRAAGSACVGEAVGCTAARLMKLFQSRDRQRPQVEEHQPRPLRGAAVRPALLLRRVHVLRRPHPVHHTSLAGRHFRQAGGVHRFHISTIIET